jgi:hypothetical protein
LSKAASDRLRVIAHFPGRLRVRADTFRVLPEVASDVIKCIEGEPGVSEVTASEVTGSILILYDPRQTQLLRLLRKLIQTSGVHGVEVDQEELESALRPGERIRGKLGDVDARVRHAAGGAVDLRVGIPGVLASLGFAKLAFGRRRIPEWYDLLFWSFVTFSNLNPPKVEPSEPRSNRHGASPDHER